MSIHDAPTAALAPRVAEHAVLDRLGAEKRDSRLKGAGEHEVELVWVNVRALLVNFPVLVIVVVLLLLLISLIATALSVVSTDNALACGDGRRKCVIDDGDRLGSGFL